MDNPNKPTDYLLEEEAFLTYNYASTGQRFLNYLIDNVLMNYGLAYATGAAVGYLISIIAPEFAYRIFVAQESQVALYAFGYLVVIFNYMVYYTACEKLFKGYTLGKLITGSRAVKDDGTELTFKNALLRTLSRLVPFEPFSGFGGHPWHDNWTRTMVVKTR